MLTESDTWPKKNSVISGKRWELQNIGKVTTYDARQSEEGAQWVIEYTEQSTMEYGSMLLDDFLERSVLLSPWLGARGE